MAINDDLAKEFLQAALNLGANGNYVSVNAVWESIYSNDPEGKSGAAVAKYCQERDWLVLDVSKHVMLTSTGLDFAKG